MKKLVKKFIGDKAFYKMVFTLVIPLMIQQGITSFVSLLDNVMVGGLGTESISAVAIVNQIMMVFNLTIFGGLSGCSIFGAQFFGNNDHKGMRDTFRFKMYFSVISAILGIIVFIFFGDDFIGMFLHSSADGGDLALTSDVAMEYMTIMLVGLLPFAISQTYAGTLRETGETMAPMISSVIAILTNLVLNYLLIFGKFGFPEMGAVGAAIGTVVSRFVELIYVVVHAHRHYDKYKFLAGAYSSFKVPLGLIKKIAVTGTPLLVNEVFWSLGMTFINQSYSLRGLNAVAAINITGTAWNIFCIMFMAMGNAVAILVGQKLGAGLKEEARDLDNKLCFMTVVIHIFMGALMIATSGLVPLLYNVDQSVRDLTTQLLIIAGAALPMHSFVHVVYFTIRSGGKTFITFLFDCLYTWVVPVPLAFFMCRYTDLSVVWLYFAVQFIDFVKVIIGVFMLKSDFWLNTIIDTDKKEKA